MSNFTFDHNVFKSRLLLLRQNASAGGKVLQVIYLYYVMRHATKPLLFDPTHIYSTVRGYNCASEDMKGNLMDTNMEQETVRDLSQRKQVFYHLFVCLYDVLDRSQQFFS